MKTAPNTQAKNKNIDLIQTTLHLTDKTRKMIHRINYDLPQNIQKMRGAEIMKKEKEIRIFQITFSLSQ